MSRTKTHSKALEQGRGDLTAELDPSGQAAFVDGRCFFAQRNLKGFAVKAQFELAYERMPKSAVAHA